ncbi:MAG: dephospho-CoA kinase [Selenomonadaceae bacterium]|nr:dephospho-CoA kinase [Selenomonadaceae bacterium]
MKVLGLTGGIASGKTAAANILIQLGANVIDTDKIAHELAKIDMPLWNAYVAHFGKDILMPDKNLDRRKIADSIFNDPKEREWIDNTAHPLIRECVEAEFARLKKKGERAAVLDAPLLFETNFRDLADYIWVVYVSKETQLSRLMQRDNVDKTAAEARLKAQMPLDEKKRLADFAICNEGSLEDLKKAVKTAWTEFLAV